MHLISFVLKSLAHRDMDSVSISFILVAVVAARGVVVAAVGVVGAIAAAVGAIAAVVGAIAAVVCVMGACQQAGQQAARLSCTLPGVGERQGAAAGCHPEEPPVHGAIPS